MEGVKRYYDSLETRLGNWMVYGGRAHLGYYAKDVWWPFPIRRALVAMEDHLFASLRLNPGAYVLDAGCGDGQVAIYPAQKGLRICAIDVLSLQVMQAQQNVRKAISKVDGDLGSRSALNALTVQQGDYHHLQPMASGSFDGVYTTETLVHATDLDRVVSEFYRVLRPGGRIAFYEYDHWSGENSSGREGVEDKVRLYGAIAGAGGQTCEPPLEKEVEGFDGDGDGDDATEGLLKALSRAGFVDIQEQDLSRNVTPLIRFLAFFLFVPSVVVSVLGLEAYFINTVAIVANYRRGWRYIAVTARKPESR
ncbi:S-adenosyl-L-methionine-dependent methyltransferase [Aspergillus avenaceus]|uniref:S-adenosyl-L-methionine-dependent methyltransferase n=1 Tax=Aspergillus avenaceus TaxID=36643 RepID=A0A5N6U222_ASPAV|nr:S-adenosyl-L-methionine-dependent methyltransferase [Aspergillus avenaceus]